MKILIESDDSISTKSRTNDNVDSFHNAVGPVILLGQLFGTMPVSGILSSDTRYVKFNWISVRVIVSIIFAIFAMVEVAAIVLMVAKDSLTLGVAGAVIFYSVCLFGNLFFIRMALHWPTLIRLWRQNEDVFLKLPYGRCKRSLALVVRAVTFNVMLIALRKYKIQPKIDIMSFCIFLMIRSLFTFEHSLYMLSVVFNNKRQIEECHLNVSFFKNLYFREKQHLARAIPYNSIVVIFFFVNNIAMTLRWSFVDVFIMALSIGVARRYNQISERLETARGKLMPESFWIEIRTHFLAMTELLQHIDEEVSLLTLLACANNLYFICFQLFNSFHPIPLLINKIYFWVALTFITARTLIMLFCASSINDASKKPLTILRCVPSVAWSAEVQRFTDQVKNEVIALSGKRFFFITRKLILAIAGTVATYELVILDQVKDDLKPAHLCDLRSITDTIVGGEN